MDKSSFGQSAGWKGKNIQQGAGYVTSNASLSAGQTGEGIKERVGDVAPLQVNLQPDRRGYSKRY